MADEDNREEGELSEEGELPEDEPAEVDVATGPHQEAAGAETAQPSTAAALVAAAPAPVSAPPAPASHVDSKPGKEGRAAARSRPDIQRREGAPADVGRDRERLRDRREERREEQPQHVQRGHPDNHDVRRRERDHDKFRVEREKAELAQELSRLTGDISFQEVRSNFVVACQDLREAIKKLDKLLRRVKKKREDDVELYPSCYEFAASIFNALKHVTVICSTGLGKLADKELANALMRTAINYRHDIFSAEHDRVLCANGGAVLCHQTSSRDEVVSETSHAAAGATSSRALPGGPSSSAAAAAEATPPSPPGAAASAAHSGGSPVPPAPPAPAAAAAASGADGAAAGTGQTSGGQEVQGAAVDGRGDDTTAAGALGSVSSSRMQQHHGSAAAAARGQIRIVLNTASVGVDGSRGEDDSAAAAAAAAAGSGNGMTSAAAGSKRPMPEIHDLEVEEYAKLYCYHLLGLEGHRVAGQMRKPDGLVLVLDLDHTLVNSAKFSEVDAEWEYKLEHLAADQLSRPKEERDLHRLGRVGMWTKLRPGVRDFLKRAAERFELWIYTAGSKAYADAMVDLLDPQGAYFGGRVIAQGVPTAPDEVPGDAVVFKRLMQGLEGREPVVLIVDDSSAVWPHDRRNLFVVERYIYFPSSRKRFGMQGKSLLEIDRDECPMRGMLMTALRVFEHLHQLVFRHMRGAPASTSPEAIGAWDVRNVMATEKKLVLQGVNLVFSRVIPLESDPKQHPLWQLAEQFGATCGEQCTTSTTHVVATHGGTEKVMWAKQNNKHVVSPAWLECSCILWQRAHEERFPTPY
eukprot:gene11392-11540_t